MGYKKKKGHSSKKNKEKNNNANKNNNNDIKKGGNSSNSIKYIDTNFKENNNLVNVDMFSIDNNEKKGKEEEINILKVDSNVNEIINEKFELEVDSNINKLTNERVEILNVSNINTNKKDKQLDNLSEKNNEKEILKNVSSIEKEFVSNNDNNFEEIKKSFSELIRKQSLSAENTRHSIIFVNEFNYDNIKENKEVISKDNNSNKVSLDDFNIISVIGVGGYGKVYLVRHKETNKIFAMKVLKKASLVLHVKDAEHTKTERQILEEVRHPFIVDLYYAFQTKERLFLLLTFACGGELFNYLQKEKMFDEDTTRFYLSEIFLALDHLHSLGIIYRDLKPENVLLDHEGHILLTDFGLSKVSLETKTLCGSLEYMAPEIILTDISYDKSVDYWSFGIMCHDLLTGKTPFHGNNRKKVMEAILKKKLTLPNYITASAKDLIIKLLRKNPAIRLGSKNGAEEVKNHTFFKNVDWKKVYNKETIPPIIPNVNGPDDLSNFSRQFTEMSTDSIFIDNQESRTSLNQSVSDNSTNNSRYSLFRGFSFVADHAF